MLSPAEIKKFISAVRSLLQAEERLYKYISLRVSQEIERDAMSSTLDFVPPVSRSRPASNSVKVEDERTIIRHRLEEKRNE